MATETIPLDGRAHKTQSAFRLEYAAGTVIKAPVARVWARMTDAAGFPGWNSTVKSIEGRIAAGETIKLIATIAPARVFTLKVTVFEPERRMVWSDGNAMFKGVRTYTFAPRPDGGTVLTMAEVYTGLMLPMIAGSLPDFGPSFEQYLADLKKATEAG